MDTSRPHITLNGTGSTVRILSHAGQILSWIPDGENSILWTSPLLPSSPSTYPRGGIFATLSCLHGNTCDSESLDVNTHLTSQHGSINSHNFHKDSYPLLANSTWHYESDISTPTHAFFTYQPQSRQKLRKHPSRVTALLQVNINDDLLFSLTVRNRGKTPVRIYEFLTAYIYVGDIKDTTISGLEGAEYSDYFRNSSHEHQINEVTFIGPTNRNYASTNPLIIEDPRTRRRIALDKGGSSSTQLWNPWREKSHLISDIPDSDWEHFLCISCENNLNNRSILPPGEEHEMTLILHVDYMD